MAEQSMPTGFAGTEFARHAARSARALSGSATVPEEVVEFDADDYATRMQLAADSAAAAGLDGILVTPGLDPIYFAGYAPVAITDAGARRFNRTDRRMQMVS